MARRSLVWVAGRDPYRGYAIALRTSLPGAVRVLDPFHVVWLGFDAVDRVRRRIQQEQTGHRGRKRMLAGLDAGDTADEQLARSWIAAQELGLIYASADARQAAEKLYRWLAYCADADIPS